MSEHLDIDLETRISKLENKLKKKSKIIETLLAEILEMKQRIQNLESERVQEEEEDENEDEEERGQEDVSSSSSLLCSSSSYSSC